MIEPGTNEGTEMDRPLVDPSILTTEQLERGIKGIERELTLRQEAREREQEAMRLLINTKISALDKRVKTKLHALHKIDKIREEHRKELKADAAVALSTATVVAEKAVNAALAASEKARDQQTLASQLATDKAEESARKALEQQGETFTTAINALNAGFNDIKGLLGELRAEKRAVQTEHTEQRAVTGQTIAIVSLVASLLGGGLIASLAQVFGG